MDRKDSIRLYADEHGQLVSNIFVFHLVRKPNRIAIMRKVAPFSLGLGNPFPKHPLVIAHYTGMYGGLLRILQIKCSGYAQQ